MNFASATKQLATGIKDRTSIMLIFNDVDCTKG